MYSRFLQRFLPTVWTFWTPSACLASWLLPCGGCTVAAQFCRGSVVPLTTLLILITTPPAPVCYNPALRDLINSSVHTRTVLIGSGLDYLTQFCTV